MRWSSRSVGPTSSVRCTCANQRRLVLDDDQMGNDVHLQCGWCNPNIAGGERHFFHIRSKKIHEVTSLLYIGPSSFSWSLARKWRVKVPSPFPCPFQYLARPLCIHAAATE